MHRNPVPARDVASRSEMWPVGAVAGTQPFDDAAVMGEFRTYLQRDKGIDFSDEAFDAEGDYIRDYLRYTLISQYHGEGVARQAVMEADLPLATAVSMLNEADTLADLFRLADRARQVQADPTGAKTALEDGSAKPDPMLLDRSTPR